MQEHIQSRLEFMRKELEKGHIELQKVESQRTHLHDTLLRICGAIQVLEELLVEGQPTEQNGRVSDDKAQLTTTLMNEFDNKQI